jgi:hypothetical protein
VTVRVFEPSHAAGQVARVDEAEALLATESGRAGQHSRRRVRGVQHPVVLMEGGHVPRDIRRDAREKACQAPQLGIAVVEPRDEQRHDLEPHARGVQPGNGVEDRLQSAAELAIVPVVETLQVDLVQIDEWPHVLQDALGAVTVGDEARQQAMGTRLPKHLDAPLRRDERLVIRRNQDPGAVPPRILDQRLRRRVARRSDRIGVAQGLRRDPVLAVTAVQITPEHAKAVRQRARMGVKERLLFDRVALHAGNVSPGHAQVAAVVEADLAHTGRADGNGALVPARVTADTGPAARAAVHRLHQLRCGIAGAGGEQILKRRHHLDRTT